MRIFVCLEEFNWKENGLGTALETVYTPVTVSHMFNRKVYVQTVQGHLLCASAV